MVFEQLYKADFLRKRPSAGFLLGIGYTILGIFLALVMFREDPALIAVGITSILLIPSLFKLTVLAEIKERKLTEFKAFMKEVFTNSKVYVFIFFGIFFTFAVFAIILPKLATNHLFREQLSIVTSGHAISFSWPLFLDLFIWNIKVLAMCFILSIVAGNGAIIFIAWNASVWGTVFGNLAKVSALAAQANPFILFLLIIISVFPHTFLEGLSYMLATISGTVLSEGLTKEQIRSPFMWRLVKYNLGLLLIAIVVLALGMLVETYVLTNFTTYRTIIQIAF